MDHASFRKQSLADYNKQPVNPEYELTTYNTASYLDGQNKKDIQRCIDTNSLVGVCDEEAGGFIAYAIGEHNAVLIAQALLFYRQHLEEKEKEAGNK